MGKEEYKRFYKYLIENDVIKDHCDEESFDSYLFYNYVDECNDTTTEVTFSGIIGTKVSIGKDERVFILYKKSVIVPDVSSIREIEEYLNTQK